MGLLNYSEQSFEELDANQVEATEVITESVENDATPCVDCTCGHDCGNYNQE